MYSRVRASALWYRHMQGLSIRAAVSAAALEHGVSNGH
jgi:hypothetical protein